MAVAEARRGLALRVDRRTVAAAVLAAAAALLVLVLTRPAPTIAVLVAAADLPAGAPLEDGSVRVRSVPSADGLVRGTGLGELAGWTLAAPLRAGEPLVPSLLRAPEQSDDPNLFSVAIDQEHAVLGRLGAGDRVDIFVTWPGNGLEPGVTELLAADVYVVDARDDGSTIGGASRIDLLFAVDDELAFTLAGAVRSGELDLMKVGP